MVLLDLQVPGVLRGQPGLLVPEVLQGQPGAPVLLVFLVLGMLAGEDGPGGIVYNDPTSAYFIGSAALAVILFEGGLNTSLATLRLAAVPALLLATLGTAVTAGVLGLVAWWLGMNPLLGLLVGAVVAPTDAAVVGVMLRHAGVRLPPRLVATLEVESGLNDPMAVFLTMLLVETLLAPAEFSPGHAALMFLLEMGGGGVLGVAGGLVIAWLLRRLRPARAWRPPCAGPAPSPCSVARRSSAPAGTWRCTWPGSRSGTRPGGQTPPFQMPPFQMPPFQMPPFQMPGSSCRSSRRWAGWRRSRCS